MENNTRLKASLYNKYIYINTYETYVKFTELLISFNVIKKTAIRRNNFKIGFYACDATYAFNINRDGHNVLSMEEVKEACNYSTCASTGSKLFKVIFGNERTIENVLNSFVFENPNIEIIDFKIIQMKDKVNDLCGTIYYTLR